MIQFIVNDDDSNFAKKVNHIINQFMFNNNEEYQIYTDSIETINKKIEYNPNINKVYILDISTSIDDAMELAIKIRKNDLKSPFIFLDDNYQCLAKLIEGHFLLLDFILKMEIENKLKKSLQSALILLNQHDMLCIKQNKMIIRIPKNEILYIMSSFEKHGSIIVTNTGKYEVSLSLINLKNKLDDSFVQSHRSCIVNSRRIITIDLKNRIIEFDNGTKIDLLSFRSKSNLKKII